MFLIQVVFLWNDPVPLEPTAQARRSFLPTLSDFIPEIVCLGVDCIVCGIVYTAYVFTNRAITSVCSAAKFDLDKQVYICNGEY